MTGSPKTDFKSRQKIKGMSSFPILDLVIGIIFVYFLLSIISSAAIELILTGLKARSKLLEVGRVLTDHSWRQTQACCLGLPFSDRVLITYV